MWSDLRSSLRALLRAKLWSAVIVATLALGIGSVCAVYSVLHTAVLRPLPFPEPEGLAMIWSSQPEQGIDRGPVSMADYLDWRELSKSFDGMSVIQESSFVLTEAGEPEEIIASLISPGFFPLLGVSPAHGRSFLPEEETVGRDRVVVLSHGLWQRRFGGDAEIVGRTLTLDGLAHTVVGVMPLSFRFPEPQVEIWTPLALRDDQRDQLVRDRRVMRVISRLADGTTFEHATEEMAALARGLAEEHPGTNGGWGVILMPLHEQMVGEVRPILVLLLATSLMVLLIACANVANLMLVRGAFRRRELAVRLALGAGRLAVIRPLMAEALWLAAAGSALGLWLAHVALRGMTALGNAPPWLEDSGLGLPVLLFALGLCGATALVIGSLPALAAWRTASMETLSGNRTSGGSGESFRRGSGHRFAGGLVAVEIALALALVINAGLLVKSFVRLAAEDPGFETQHVLSAHLTLPKARYAQRAQVTDFYQRLVAAVAARPGVRAVAMTSALPMSPLGRDFDLPFEVAGRPRADRSGQEQVHVRIVSPHFFRTMGIPLLAGRVLSEHDRSGGPPVALVNRALARQTWRDADPVGEYLSMPFGAWTRYEIVGVVGDVRHQGLDSRPQPEIYLPFAQNPFRAMALVARLENESVPLAENLAAEISELDDRMPVPAVASMAALIAAKGLRRSAHTRLIAVLAVIATVLAAIGIYATASYRVARHWRDFGVRRALGASSRQILRVAVAPTATWITVGIVLGLVSASASTRLLEHFLFGVSAFDPAVFTIAAAAFATVALLGSVLPASRAVHLDPAIVLREE